MKSVLSAFLNKKQLLLGETFSTWPRRGTIKDSSTGISQCFVNLELPFSIVFSLNLGSFITPLSKRRICPLTTTSAILLLQNYAVYAKHSTNEQPIHVNYWPNDQQCLIMLGRDFCVQTLLTSARKKGEPFMSPGAFCHTWGTSQPSMTPQNLFNGINVTSTKT